MLSPPVQTPDSGTGQPLSLGSRKLRARTIDRFTLDQSTLPSNAASELDSMVIWIKAARPVIVWVTGHTDISGTEQHNQQLSEARAAEVRQALIDRGIDASVIETKGEGETNPALPEAANPNEHARNRRVTVEWFDPLPSGSGFRLRPPPWLNDAR